MRLATWNVNGLRARLEFLQHWLAARRPDVVGLQELKLTDDAFPHDALETAGYRALVHGQKSWNGVAILTRTDAPAPTLLRAGLPGQETFGARLIAAELAGGLRFATVYCPNGKRVEHDDYPRKLAWFDALAALIERGHAPDEPFVICGDFNICPQPLDSWNEELLGGSIFHTDEERARMRRLLDWGLIDLYRRLEPETKSFSWWDYRGGSFHRNRGLRIDFLLGTEPVATALRAVSIDRDYRKKQDGLTASDHAPVIADLDPDAVTRP